MNDSKSPYGGTVKSAAEEYANKKALPIIRSMFSCSRGELAEMLIEAVEYGQKAGAAWAIEKSAMTAFEVIMEAATRMDRPQDCALMADFALSAIRRLSEPEKG